MAYTEVTLKRLRDKKCPSCGYTAADHSIGMSPSGCVMSSKRITQLIREQEQRDAKN